MATKSTDNRGPKEKSRQAAKPIENPPIDEINQPTSEQTTQMQQQLVTKLWDENLKYLINYFEDGKKDEHFYIGSLLAAYFNLLDIDKKEALMQTATQHIIT